MTQPTSFNLAVTLEDMNWNTKQDCGTVRETRDPFRVIQPQQGKHTKPAKSGRENTKQSRINQHALPLITGFYPDEKQDDSLQFWLDIKGNELNEKVAYLIESKSLNEVEPGELLLNESQAMKCIAVISTATSKRQKYL